MTTNNLELASGCCWGFWGVLGVCVWIFVLILNFFVCCWVVFFCFFLGVVLGFF